MKITIFGSDKPVIKELVQKALNEDYQVVLFARSLAKFKIEHDHLTVVEGELDDAEAIERAITGTDAVISLLTPINGLKGTPISTVISTILMIMEKVNVRRMILLGTASITDPHDLPEFKVKLLVNATKLLLPSAHKQLLKVADIVRSSQLDWTVVRVPLLNNQSPTGQVRIGYYGQEQVKMSITRKDLAHFMLGQVKDMHYIKQAPAISN